MTCNSNSFNYNSHKSDPVLPTSPEVATYPSRIRDAKVDWATVVAENQETERVYDQLQRGIYSFVMDQDRIACSGIAAVSNLPSLDECNLTTNPTYKPRHF